VRFVKEKPETERIETKPLYPPDEKEMNDEKEFEDYFPELKENPDILPLSEARRYYYLIDSDDEEPLRSAQIGKILRKNPKASEKNVLEFQLMRENRLKELDIVNTDMRSKKNLSYLAVLDLPFHVKEWFFYASGMMDLHSLTLQENKHLIGYCYVLYKGCKRHKFHFVVDWNEEEEVNLMFDFCEQAFAGLSNKDNVYGSHVPRIQLMRKFRKEKWGKVIIGYYKPRNIFYRMQLFTPKTGTKL
jgi:hypothetical protein